MNNLQTTFAHCFSHYFDLLTKPMESMTADVLVPPWPLGSNSERSKRNKSRKFLSRDVLLEHNLVLIRNVSFRKIGLFLPVLSMYVEDGRNTVKIF